MLACRSAFPLVFVWRMPNSEEIRRIFELGLKVRTRKSAGFTSLDSNRNPPLLILQRRRHKSLEQRVRPVGTGFQLRVSLSCDIEGML